MYPNYARLELTPPRSASTISRIASHATPASEMLAVILCEVYRS